MKITKMIRKSLLLKLITASTRAERVARAIAHYTDVCPSAYNLPGMSALKNAFCLEREKVAHVNKTMKQLRSAGKINLPSKKMDLILMENTIYASCQRSGALFLVGTPSRCNLYEVLHGKHAMSI